MNFDPQTVKMAMDQMKNMSPSQMRQMMSSFPSSAMSPEMRAAANQMQGMSDDDWSRACNQFKDADPNTVAKQAAEAQSKLSAYGDYVVQASNQLKTEGNDMHKAGKFKEALDKYNKALDNLKDKDTEAAKTIKKACSLNICSCYLKLQDYDKCISNCTQILTEYGVDLKAYYRRGQAYAGIQKWKRADRDLSRALKMSSSDSTERSAIKEKLQEVKDQRGQGRADGVVESDSESEPDYKTPSSFSSSLSSVKIEEINDAPSSSAAAAAAATAAAANPEKVKEAMDFLKKNPEKGREIADMISSMPPDQIQNMMRAAGAPEGFNASPEMIKFAMDAMKNLSPEELERLSQSAPKDMLGGRGGSSSSSSISNSKSGVSNNDSNSNNDSKNSNSKDNSRGAGGFGGGLGGLNGLGDMDAMLNDPNMLKTATAMMRNMDKDTLASLMVSSGMCQKEQAEVMAAKMKGLTDTQVGLFITFATYVQKAVKAAKETRKWMRKNWMIVLAVVLILIGIYMRK